MRLDTGKQVTHNLDMNTDGFAVDQLRAFSNLSLASGVSFDGSKNTNSLAFGLVSPNLPIVAGNSSSRVSGSSTLGYVLIVFSLAVLAVFLYFSRQKKGVAHE